MQNNPKLCLRQQFQLYLAQHLADSRIEAILVHSVNVFVRKPLLLAAGHIFNITARPVEARSEWTTLQKAPRRYVFV
jgi:hypothetical protein